MARLNTRKKKTVDVDELRAYRVAYGSTLGFRDYMKYIGYPALLAGAFSFIILYNVWVTIVMVLIGGFYGLTVILPKSVRKQYESEAFIQRNKFINNITQVLTDDAQTVYKALGKVTTRSSGEFKEDLQRFNAKLLGADQEGVREAVIWFSDRYEDDVIFIQYLEQLETALLEGKNNIDTLKDIKTYHNDIRKKQTFYEREKTRHLSDMKVLVIIVAVMIGALAISFGFDTYLEAYARHPIGYISATLYGVLMMFFFRQFTTYMFDDSVMEIRRK